MSVFGRNYVRAVETGSPDFWADGRLWSVAEVQKIRCSPASIPAKVKASLEGSKPTPKPMSSNPYLPLARATASEFRQAVERLMQQNGLTRLEATRLLSEASGLSEQRQSVGGGTIGRFAQMKRQYFNR